MFFKVPKRKYTLERKDNPKRRKLNASVESLDMVGELFSLWVSIVLTVPLMLMWSAKAKDSLLICTV